MVELARSRLRRRHRHRAILTINLHVFGRRHRLSPDHSVHHTRPALDPVRGIEDVHPQCGRELCGRARVKMRGTQEPNRSSDGDLPVPWSPAHPPAVPGPRKTLAEIRCVDPRGSASRLGIRNTRPGARDVPRPVRDGTACCRGHRASATQRRSLWLDQASARRALAVPPRGISDASATTATSFRCSPETPVRSRRPPSAAA